jgi:hypothetical protein
VTKEYKINPIPENPAWTIENKTNESLDEYKEKNYNKPGKTFNILFAALKMNGLLSFLNKQFDNSKETVRMALGKFRGFKEKIRIGLGKPGASRQA